MVANRSALVMNSSTASWRDYLGLCKLKVVLLMIITSVVGMCLSVPGAVPLSVFVGGNVGIALAAASAAALNHVVDQHIDRVMKRTQQRPLVQQKVSTVQALVFSFVLCLTSMIILCVCANVLTAVLTLFSLIAYAGIYTLYLKHATPQNIVIGGIAGAAPPLLGWVAVTGSISPDALLLVLIIYVWTPPHFWALAIHRVDEYAKADVPMLPCTHGVTLTKQHILFYTILLFVVTLLPVAIHQSGWVYAVMAFLLNSRFLYMAIRLQRSTDERLPFRVFKYSIVYLMYLFLALLADHYWTLIHSLR